MQWLSGLVSAVIMFFSGIFGVPQIPAVVKTSTPVQTQPSTVSAPIERQAAATPAQPPTPEQPSATPSPSPASSDWIALLNNAQAQSGPQEPFIGYAEDGGKVMFQASDSSPLAVVTGADPYTFSTYNLDSGIGKDKNSVYYEGAIIANADPASFGFIKDEDAGYGPDAKDISHIFCYSATLDSYVSLLGADVNTFSELFDFEANHYAKDKNHVYVNCSIDPNIDAQDFAVLPYGGDAGDGSGPEGPLVTYFKNDEGVYFVNINSNGDLVGSADPALVVGADPDTFVVTNWVTEEGHDKNHTFIQGKMVQ